MAISDSLHPHARSYLALAAAFATATAVRMLCISPKSPIPIFAHDLQKNLAPIERDDITWWWIAATRLIDLTLSIYIWSREAGGTRRRTDGPLLGALLCLIVRVPLYLLLSHHFLVSFRTLGQVLITDLAAGSAALWVISKIEPRQPSFFQTPTVDHPLKTATRGRLEMLFYAIGIATSANALYSYVAERLYMQDMIRKNVLEHSVPAYLSSLQPSMAEAMAHPTVAIPILRSALESMSMPQHILYALPLSLLLTVLSLFVLPQKSPNQLAFLSFLLVAPSNALSVFNLLPIKAEASTTIGIENGFKAAVVAYIVSQTLDEWRRPGAVKSEGQEPGVIKDVSDQASGVVIVDGDSVTFREERAALPDELIVKETEELVEE